MLNSALGGTTMGNPVMMDVNPDEAVRIEAAIDECFAAMKLANTKLGSRTWKELRQQNSRTKRFDGMNMTATNISLSDENSSRIYGALRSELNKLSPQNIRNFAAASGFDVTKIPAQSGSGNRAEVTQAVHASAKARRVIAGDGKRPDRD